MTLHASTRRELLLGSGALFAWAHVPRLARAEGRDPRFLTIVLRGALDGLATVAPVGDPDRLDRGNRVKHLARPDRVQTLADPGTVLITARVQRQVAGLFVAEDRGLHELKGVPTPLALYRIVRASGDRKGRNAFFVSALAQVPSRRASPAQPEPTTHPALDAA